ncbi:basic salivary proline-rich protein 4-like [Panicum virgatum]|uniref:Uncharacterized protein n=1 Tax=Panicum virgatum TaxID=38727 RepID=A0A8T0SB28_PANVG|nr:basic salivary proline-rich protein 4-like [Panicum virgatum]KAG2595427.1 hypothetical protein PVAP13_5KG073700 [Panicum virgatum]
MAAPIRASPPLLLTAIVLLATLLLASASFPSALAAYDDVPQEEGAGYARFCQKHHCGGRKLQQVADPLRSTPPPPAPGGGPPIGPAPTVPIPPPPLPPSPGV